MRTAGLLSGASRLVAFVVATLAGSGCAQVGDVPSVEFAGADSDPAAPPPARTLTALASPLRFTDVTSDVKLSVDNPGNSVAWGDLDGDGRPDLVVPTGDSGVVVFLNRPNGTFERMGTGNPPGGLLAVSLGDYDNDGALDVAACGGGGISVFKGHGDGTIELAASWPFDGARDRKPDPSDMALCTMIGFYDVDFDGRLDLFASVGRPARPHLPPLDTATCDGPMASADVSEVARDRLMLQTASGEWEDAAASRNLDDPGNGQAFAFGRWLADDAPALLIGNERGPNGLFPLPFHASTVDTRCGAGVSPTQATMGVLPVDLDRDGFLDVLLSDFMDAKAFLNDGQGRFTHVPDALGIAEGTRGYIGWGMVAADFDNDADLDLVIANAAPSHDSESVAKGAASLGFMGMGDQIPIFLLGVDGRYAPLDATASFFWLDDVVDAHGVQTADYDLDGDVDMLLTGNGNRLWLMRNDSTSQGSWLALSLRGTASNRSAFGSIVRVRVGGAVLVQQLAGPTGSAGMNEPVLHFGLGSATRADAVDVTFPSGKKVHLGPTDGGLRIMVSEP